MAPTRNPGLRSPAEEHDRALSALHALDPECDRESWVKLAMASQAAGLDLEDFDRWSSGASNYSERETRSMWRSIRPEGGVGAGTLFHMAHEAGWRDTSSGLTFQSSKMEPIRPKASPNAQAPGATTAEVWARCVPATDLHPYIVAKQAQGVPLHGLRVVPADDPLKVAGLSMAGALVVPVLPLEGGEPVSLQFIAGGAQADEWKAACGHSKLNLRGAKMAGVFVVGEVSTGGTVYLCEGIGQAWACWQATGRPAVVAFGWDRVEGVATELRQRDPAARLVLVPDVGKETKAFEIAAEVGARVATMPPEWPNNADVADFAKEAGKEALERLLEQAVPPPDEPHPLAEFVPVDGQVRPPRWVIPGFIAEGVVMIAGLAGVGKTSCLLPLAMVAAHLCSPDDPLRPRHWRHVIYISEDVDQALRILAGARDHGSTPLNVSLVAERFHLVPATRLKPQEAVRVGRTYRRRFSRIVDGIELLPLVVIDTRSAVLALEDENSNSEGSKALAALKQRFEGLPTWVIGHLPKGQQYTRNKVREISTRGAGSWDGDANQTLFVVQEGEQRFIAIGKPRFEANWPELAVAGQVVETVVPDEFGVPCTIRLRWGIPRPYTLSVNGRLPDLDARRLAAHNELRDTVLDVVRQAWQVGFPLTKEGVKEKIPRRKEETGRTVSTLVADQWLMEVEIPANQRTNPRRASFLVALTAEERDTVISGGKAPAEKLVIPASMTKAAA
jgi:putative DNA primase/helicase